MKNSSGTLKTILIFLCLSAGYIVNAQTGPPCAFQSLFTFEPGMNKMVVMDSINKTYKLKVVSRKTENIKSSTDGNPIVKEVVAYTIDGSACFKGHNSKLQLEFADDKLYKAYLSTVYSKSTYSELISNFNSLRSSIKPHWEFENGIKLSGKNTTGFGYMYARTKKTPILEQVTLQYTDYNTNDANSSYILEVVWANVTNTRMKGSASAKF